MLLSDREKVITIKCSYLEFCNLSFTPLFLILVNLNFYSSLLLISISHHFHLEFIPRNLFEFPKPRSERGAFHCLLLSVILVACRRTTILLHYVRNLPSRLRCDLNNNSSPNKFANSIKINRNHFVFGFNFQQTKPQNVFGN